jgi:hypothetical protein
MLNYQRVPISAGSKPTRRVPSQCLSTCPGSAWPVEDGDAEGDFGDGDAEGDSNGDFGDGGCLSIGG